MNKRRVAGIMLVTSLVGGAAFAEEPHHGAGGRKSDAPGQMKKSPEGDMKAMMAAWEKAGTPGPEHKMLQRAVGKWKLQMKSWMEPGKPPVESSGTAEAKSILNGRFIQMDVSAKFMGKPFNGMAINGYDNTKKKFVGTWIDSMATAISRSEGTADASGKVITTTSVCSDPTTGKDHEGRMIEKWENDTKFVEEFYEKVGPKEVKKMEITYTKVASK